MDYDIVIPLFSPNWNTRCVLEALQTHYTPRGIYLLTPERGIEGLAESLEEWDLNDVHLIPEETFFLKSHGVTKDDLASIIPTEGSLYPAGWYFQQLLKLGAGECIPGLSEPYLVWDSDLLLVDSWPCLVGEGPNTQFATALLQHNSRGNAKIVSMWEAWIRDVLRIEPAWDEEATFIPHHMWFHRSVVEDMMEKLHSFYDSDEPWPMLMMRSGVDFTTFGEFWIYSSWAQVHCPELYTYHPYESYGATTERFFDDGTGAFSMQLRESMGVEDGEVFEPSFEDVQLFIEEEYGYNPPSSLSFEASKRHLKKGQVNRHLEETRSRWSPDNLLSSMG